MPPTTTTTTPVEGVVQEIASIPLTGVSVREGYPVFVMVSLALSLELIFLFDAEIIMPASFSLVFLREFFSFDWCYSKSNFRPDRRLGLARLHSKACLVTF